MKYLRISLVVLSLFIAASSNNTLSDQRLFGRNGGETCPTWFVPTKRSDDNGTVCHCGNPIRYSVLCKEQTNQSFLEDDNCMTYDTNTNMTFLSKCPYNSLREPRSDYTLLPQNVSRLNNFMCGGLNRTGLLCGHCSPGFGPGVLTYDMKCVKCLDSAYGWLLYTLIALGPTTVIFLVVLLLQVRATSAPMNAFVFMCHFVAVSATGYKNEFFQHHASPVNFYGLIIVSFYGIWELEFFRSVIPQFCISDIHTMLLVLSLEYVVEVYPLFLVVISYICIQLHSRGCRVLVCLWIPFKSCFACLGRRGFDPSQSLVHAFTTFLLLSYAKFLYTSLNLLRFTELHSSTARKVGPPVLYYNASVPFLGEEHIPFAILAVLMLAIFSVLPLLVVFLYPTRVFQKCLNCCRIRWHSVHAFADAFNGCYKDGTNGTWDYRYFAGFYLLLRVLFLASWYINPWDIGGLLNGIWPFIASLMFALMRPYKQNWFNILDSLQLALLGFIVLGTMYCQKVLHVISKRFIGVVAILPLLYFIAYIICKITLCTSVLDKCDCHRLKALMQQVTGTYNNTPHLRCYDDDDVPHQLLHPNEYDEVQMDLDQANSEDDPIQETVPTYGAIV